MAPAANPAVAVLCADHRPPGMATVEEQAEVRYTNADDLADAIDGADALFVWDFFSTAVADAWTASGAISWIHVASAGVDRLLFPALVDSDVVVTNSRGVFERPIAEYVLGLLLAFAKDLPGTLRAQEAGRWVHRETQGLGGRRALVVGSGPIGREIGRLLAAVGVEVSLVGRARRDSDSDFGVVHASTDLLSLLPDADYVVAAAPLTDATRGMFGAEAFAAMRPGARFVNIGRGQLVDEAALVDALRSGRIAGAALDVFAQEPLPAGHPLWTLDGVLVSPHMAGDVVGWHDDLARLFVANFGRWRSGAPLHNIVDKRLGYVPGS
ncbi:MAG TPA: D-2-hydroxyacid dehydrogenase [Nocardioidaceae bacterium]|nr:D-2-hydroxyacid dehydrogenase [Nocardioidaceae bacterium]